MSEVEQQSTLLTSNPLSDEEVGKLYAFCVGDMRTYNLMRRLVLYGQVSDDPTPAVETSGWLSIETAPKDGRTLLLGYYNSAGKWRTMRGQWFSRLAIDEEWEEPENGSEGWYETSVENDDPPNCWWTDPTHWMPLPKSPEKGSEQGK